MSMFFGPSGHVHDPTQTVIAEAGVTKPIKKKHENPTSFKNIMCLEMPASRESNLVETCAPENPGDRSYRYLEILNMGSIS